VRPVLVVALWLLTPHSIAFAQPTADELFSSGLEAMKRGDYAAACPAIAESYRLDPLPGALFTLAECDARAGRVASSWGRFGEFLQVAQGFDQATRERQAERIAAAARRRAELEVHLSHLKLALPTGISEAATLEHNGSPVAREQWGEPLLVDPGVHRLVLRVPTGEITEIVNVERGREYVVRFAEPEPAPLAPASGTPTTKSKPPRSRAASESGVGAARIGGWVALGLGAAGLATASGVGIVLLSKKDAIVDNCVEARCNEAGFAEAADVGTLDAVGTAAFVVGAAAAVLGVSLLIVDSSVNARSDGQSAMLSYDTCW
jgi:hypothetical protein